MSDLISTDQPFTLDEQEILDGLLDTLMPASDDGRMPSASDVGFVQYLTQQDEPFIPEVKSVLAALGHISLNTEFEARYERVGTFSNEDPQAFSELLSRVYDCYYQDDRVRQAIGVVTGAPFPQGNEIISGDLSLLDPVIAEEDRHRYRKIK
ncbi:MAG: hypothetical protein VYE04_11125 [Pseudomonadota bacterium]|nr:hypothetical protein [Pseudomonadota bacterium]